MTFNKHSYRINYIDYLRSIAMFAVILMHVSILFPNIKFLNCKLGTIFECCRFAVPLFLALTGSLLLNRQYSGTLKDFFVKRSSKLILPYVFWIGMLIILTFYFNHITYFNLDVLKLVLSFFFDSGVLWYFWIILGVYLFIPVINDFILRKGLNGAKYFLVVCVVGSIFYQICNIFGLFSFVDFRFFIGPIIYVVLGFYLRFNEFNLSRNKMILISFVLFVVTSLLKIGFNVIPGDVSYFYALNNHSWNMGENIFFETYLDVGILEIVQVSSIFLLFRYLSQGSGAIKRFVFNSYFVKFLTSTSKSTWGMYLSHATFLIILPIFISHLALTGTEGFLATIVISVFVFLATWIITLILHKIPYLNKVSGYY